jgi:hypothetical protein
MSDELEAVITAHLNGDTSDPLKTVLMQGLNTHLDPTDPVALNNDAALKAIIVNTIKGNQ